MRKRILVIILVIIVLFCTAYLLLRKQKETIPCAKLQRVFPEYPLNYEELYENADSCGSIHNVLRLKEKLIFSADGVVARIGKKEQESTNYSGRTDKEVNYQQLQYHGVIINIWYSAKHQKDNTDIYARFVFEIDDFVVRGDIRGLYTDAKHSNMAEVPTEVFDRTQQRILEFIETYFVVLP